MNEVIIFKDVIKEYVGFTLSIKDLSIHEGEIFGLVGKNGSGKTTLIDLVLNEKLRNSGSIFIFGKDNIKYERSIKEEIGFVIDDAGFSKEFTLREIGSVLENIYEKWDKQQFFHQIESLGLEKTMKIGSLSKGMSIKAQFAIAITHKPRLLLFDEITSGLDPVSRIEILDLLSSYLLEDNRRAILFSTHLIEDLNKIATTVGLLNNGSFAFIRKIEEFANESVEEQMLKFIDNKRISA